MMKKSHHLFSRAFPGCSFTPVSAQQEPSSNSLTADNLEKFGKLNHSPGVPEDGALLSEAKLQSIISFLDEMEKSEQERPRSSASATQREVSAEARAHSCLRGGARPWWDGSLVSFFWFQEVPTTS